MGENIVDTEIEINNPDKNYMYTCLSCGVIISQSKWGSWMGSSLDDKMKNKVIGVFNSLHGGKPKRTSYDCQAAHLFHETLFGKGPTATTETKTALSTPKKNGAAFRLGCKS